LGKEIKGGIRNMSLTYIWQIQRQITVNNICKTSIGMCSVLEGHNGIPTESVGM
jgi:hypothetical protein